MPTDAGSLDPPFDTGFCYKMGFGEGGRGLNIAVIDPNNGRIEDCRNFDTYYSLQAFVTLTNYISDSNAIPPGRLILAAMADEAGFIQPSPANTCHTPYADARVERAYKAFERLGSAQIRQVGYWGSWALIAIKGRGALAEGHRDPVYVPPIADFCQLSARRSTQITATTPISTVYPGYTIFLPDVLR